MSKTFLIKQPAGIGDIFFLQKAVYYLSQYGNKIIWPVIDEFIWIKNYIISPHINFISLNEDFEHKEEFLKLNPNIREISNTIIIPFQHSDWLYNNISVMDAKYKLIDLDFEDWDNYFNFKRNIKKENQLYYDVLNLTDNSDYVFINRQYASPPHTEICKYIDLNKFSNYIEMKYLENFTIFDWCKVIENAKEIHTVETSLNYIIDKIKPKGKLEMYSKHTPPNYNQVKHLFKSNWNFNG